MPRIVESELIVPTLEILEASPHGEMSTSGIIAKLTERFKPRGEDAWILNGRNDTKFSQIVRNLKSHGTLVNSGLAEDTEDGFRITESGRKQINNH
ncbi:MAG: hypothetical protein JKY92_09530 [Magnetovibrio sp.]|nr:hypothetical protein [Magnetovibrio sp.]